MFKPAQQHGHVGIIEISVLHVESDIVVAGRGELLRMHRADEIHDSVLQAIEEGLDLEEVNARRHL